MDPLLVILTLVDFTLAFVTLVMLIMGPILAIAHGSNDALLAAVLLASYLVVQVLSIAQAINAFNLGQKVKARLLAFAPIFLLTIIALWVATLMPGLAYNGSQVS